MVWLSKSVTPRQMGSVRRQIKLISDLKWPVQKERNHSPHGLAMDFLLKIFVSTRYHARTEKPIDGVTNFLWSSLSVEGKERETSEF